MMRGIGCLVLASGMTLGALFLGVHLLYWADARVELTVTNNASVPVDVVMLRGGRDRIVGISALAPGASGADSDHCGEVSSYVLRITVGERTFEDRSGPLLDDDGPHRFSLDVRDERVLVTRQANEGPYSYELPRAAATTFPKGRRRATTAATTRPTFEQAGPSARGERR